jgi:hypothetical protein
VVAKDMDTEHCRRRSEMSQAENEFKRTLENIQQSICDRRWDIHVHSERNDPLKVGDERCHGGESLDSSVITGSEEGYLRLPTCSTEFM